MTATTKTVRVPADLAEMLNALARMGPEAFSTAAFLDPLIRQAVEREFARLPAVVRRRFLVPRPDKKPKPKPNPKRPRSAD